MGDDGDVERSRVELSEEMGSELTMVAWRGMTNHDQYVPAPATTTKK